MSEVLEPPVTHPVTAALGALQAALDQVVQLTVPGPDGELWMLSGAQLLDAAEVVHRVTRRADAVLHGLVREIDARGAATEAGAHSTAGWLRARLHLHPGAARRMVTTSRALHDDPSGVLVHHAAAAPAPGGRHLLRSRQALVLRQHDDGSSDVRGHLGVELTAELLSQLQPLAGPRPSTDGQPDLRTVGQRKADARAELLRRAAIAGGTPARHGSRASITVTMALETLERRLGAPAATLDWSGPISAATARRLACDAQLVPLVLGAHGEPLDVGRASYPVTQAIWRALVARDGGCAFHGCGRPPEWTEAHHRIHWADGGETSVANCCLFCDHHHRVVHNDGWQVVLIDGVVHVIPPPWVDPDQQPRPNTNPERAGHLNTLPKPPGHDRR